MKCISSYSESELIMSSKFKECLLAQSLIDAKYPIGASNQT